MTHLVAVIFLILSMSQINAAEDASHGISENEDPGLIESYKPNYFLISKNGGDNNDGKQYSDCDVKFQFSFRKRLYAPHIIWTNISDKVKNYLGAFYFSYTQKSFWDICRTSAPFRENNYNPSLFFDNTLGTKTFKSISYLLDNSYGYEHESNGEDGSVSRSWDRLFYEQRVSFGDKISQGSFKGEINGKSLYRHKLTLRVWQIIADGSNNTDVEDYLGRLEAAYAWTGNDNRVQITGRKKNVRLDWYFKKAPVFKGRKGEYYWLLQYFNGYGDSLERYNIKENVLRAGVAFSY